jgi:hypothetical protein
MVNLDSTACQTLKVEVSEIGFEGCSNWNPATLRVETKRLVLCDPQNAKLCSASLTLDAVGRLFITPFALRFPLIRKPFLGGNFKECDWST